MKRRVRLLSALAAGTLAFVVGTSTAHAINSAQYPCQVAIAKEGLNFVKGELKLWQKCREANLVGDTCVAPVLTKPRLKLFSGIAKKCTFPTNTPGNLRGIGFPGQCDDPDPLNGFTLLDLQNCMQDTHEAIINSMLAVEYDSGVTIPLTGTALTCQKAIASNSAKFVAALMKNVQKCRNNLLNCKTDAGPPIITVCKLTGVLAEECATGDPKTKAAIDKAREKANAAIIAKCSNPADVATIKACVPDQANGTAAATCELNSHQAVTDNPDSTALSDLLDYEYAKRGLCGDDRVNLPNEECDGASSAACPGLCGAASGLFPCLCQDSAHKRTRVVEHANSDLDNGWTGQSHDSGIVEGGGYVTDLWDCDGPAGPDTICHVGPTCSLGLQEPCSPLPNPSASLDTGNKICAAKVPSQGTCRKTAGGATGPHCEIDFQKRCTNNSQCPTFGDRCVFVPHGAPLPISSGGVSVCVVNTFTEDVVGTTNLSTTIGPGPGAGAVRLRQNSATYLGPDQEQPCPVCGGFCSGSAGATTPGTRNLCSSNADCNGGAGTCITASVCSWGPNIDKACNPNTPSGGVTEFFGNPSVDCPMSGLLLGNIDILFNPATTGDAAPLTTNTDCGNPGWTDKVCAGGPNQHKPCTADAECLPGGTCNEQCFCGGGAQKPNACEPACLDGAFDGQPCSDDSECDPPNGFCHPGDCRPKPSDTDSTQEGICTAGPSDGRCSVHTFKPCIDNAGCGGGLCPFCDPGETCVQVPRQCFVNPTMTRAGKPAVTGANDHDRTTAATFCISSTTSAAVNSTAGLPGPGAITTTETISESPGF